MLPLLPCIAGGMLITAGLNRKHKVRTLTVQALSALSTKVAEKNITQPAHLKNAITQRLQGIDNDYQSFIQKRLDPLLGKTRSVQLQTAMNVTTPSLLSKYERNANRRLGLGALAMSLAVCSIALPPLMLFAVVLGFTSTLPTYQYAWQQWKARKQLTALHLMCIYVACMWFGGYATFGALGSLLLGIALKVNAVTQNQSKNRLVHIEQCQPSHVWVRYQGDELEIPFDQLAIGDTLVLHAGQIVPVDGKVVAGMATIDQHQLTGEAQPAEKQTGDQVFATTLLISGQLDVCVEKTGTETTAGQVEQILNNTAQYQTQTALKAAQLTNRLALPTLAASAMSAPLIGPVGAITLLGANSTFATEMSSPVGVLNFLNLAAEHGILIKEGCVLESLNDVDTIVFDKTGTLTLEQPCVAQIHTFQDWSAEQLLAYAAAAESRQTHPIARAILMAAEERDLSLPPIDPVHYELGFGLKVRLLEDVGANPAKSSAGGTGGSDKAVVTRHGDTSHQPLLRVGSYRFMTLEGIPLNEEAEALVEASQALGHSLVWVAMDDVLLGCIELQPTLRPEVPQMIQQLRERHLDLYILSGDQEAPTRQLAEELGMTGYFANTLPVEKAERIAELQQAGRCVCFIGDGINDAAAMRQAQVSVSLLGATTVATDTAQIILMEGKLDALLHLFYLANNFERNLQHNFRFTSGVSLLATTGVFLAGFTFAATEMLFFVSMMGGLGIAMMPLLSNQKKALTK
ncbi:MAG: heavy metal translocating P-type ATPase [Pseudomonadota bacterium]